MGCNTSQEKATAPPQQQQEEGGGGGGEGDSAAKNGECGDNVNNVETELKNSSDKQKSPQKIDKKIELEKSQIDSSITANDSATTTSKSNHTNNDELPTLNGKDEEDAALKIQAVFRGHKVRASMKQGDSSTNKAEEAVKVPSTNNAEIIDEPTKEELEAEFREDDKELCDAATRIQATFRGHLARKIAVEGALKDEKDLQEITKKVAEELDIDLSDPELNKAATKIQASFRGHKARRNETDADN